LKGSPALFFIGRHRQAAAARNPVPVSSAATVTKESGIPINLTQRWLGHARMTTTAIYAAACGPEELALADRFWKASPISYGRRSFSPK